MEYGEARSYMKEMERYGSRPGLDTIRELLRRLGNPQNDYPVVQIAGTNGKGSVGAFLAAILREAHIPAGRFFSPAVFEERETISFAGDMISEEEYAACLTQVAAASKQMQEEGAGLPTVFETETALAFLYFSQKVKALSKEKRARCADAASSKDVIVLTEAGMGGRLDATNVTEGTVLSLITSISMDHTSFLGNTLAEIAAHKAGIIRPGGLAVTVEQQREAGQVLEDFCRKENVKLLVADPQLLPDVPLGLTGVFQRENAALAYCGARCLRELGYEISQEAMERGLANAVWRGRMEKLGSRPDVWIDGAHNPDAVRRLREALLAQYGSLRLHAVMGVFRDKEPEAMCALMSDLFEKVYTVTPPGPRGLPAKELEKIARKYCRNTVSCGTVREAVESAVDAAGPEGVTLIFGSLSYLGQAVAAYQNRKVKGTDRTLAD